MKPSFYQKMLELVPVGYAFCEAVLDNHQNIVDFLYVDVNQSFKTILGLNNVEIIGKKRSELFSSDETDVQWAENFKDVLKNQSHRSFKLYSKIINKHLKIDLYSPEKYKIAMFMTDITKEVIDSVEKSILLKTTNDVILELNEDYIFTNLYTNYEQYVDKNNFIDKHVSEVFNEKVTEQFYGALKQAKQTELSAIIDYQLNEEYEQRWFQSSVFYVKFDQEYRYVISTHEITAQKSIENQLIETNERLTQITSQSRTVIWEVDKDGMYTYINPMSKNVFGYEPEEMIGTYFYKNYPEEFRLEYKEKVLEQMNRHVIVSDFESPYLTKDGEKLWLLSYSFPMFDNNGNYRGYRGSDTDITEKHNVQLALKQSEEKYRFITENTSDVIWILNLEKLMFTYISPAIYNLRGFTPDEAMAQTVEESMTKESWDLVQKEIERTLGIFILNPNNDSNNMMTIQQLHKDGSIKWIEISTRYRFNVKNEIEVIGISRDVTERKINDDEIRYLSYHDQLTGLYNRRYFEMEIERLDTLRNHPISVITIDINGLKMTNDVFGHNAGDELIKQAARTLKQACREDEIIVRLGGDEFLILLPRTNEFDCIQIINRVQDIIRKEKDNKYLLSVSLGYGIKHSVDNQIKDIINQADQYMYQNKLIESEIHKRQLLGIIMKRLYRLDPDLRRHLKSMNELITQFGHYLKLKKEHINELKLAAMYHDIGKIGIDENDVKLFQTDRIKYAYLLKRQPELSYQILRYITEYIEIANIILAYHENFNGTGYPRGIRGNDIPMESMMIHIVNNYDKLRFNVGLSVEEAIKHLQAQKSIELEPKLCDQFCEMIKSYE
ncbi:MAG TPA: PAS domain S-box protein [Erysipelotrichaceae bacterium]|nr:PAS domain S-box protein [Erysipelotrichaceae bacterium]